jgi:FMN phosphatase YigB (HAD superfamily)
MPRSDVPSLALFDLDNTLVDRETAFFAWAQSFAGHYVLN